MRLRSQSNGIGGMTMLEFIVPFTDKAAAEKFDRYHGTNGELVRCKDCKHRDPEDKKCDYGGMAVQGLLFPRPDDWYCADGERRDSE